MDVTEATRRQPHRWHPWRTLRDHYPHVEVLFTDLPAGVWGQTDGVTVWLDYRLNQAQRRCVLTHELWHIKRGLNPNDPDEERICDELAARDLIPLLDLIDGFRWTTNPTELATILWVDAHTLRVRLETLDPIEVADLEYETDGAWWQWH